MAIKLRVHFFMTLDYNLTRLSCVLRTGGLSGSVGASGDSWLTSAQSSPSAWQFAFELVDVNKSPEVQFFGANTIVIKVHTFISLLIY